MPFQMAIQRTDSMAESAASVASNPASATAISSGATNAKKPLNPVNIAAARSLRRDRSIKASASICQSPSMWLFIWTLNNIGITLLNKAAFATVDFQYPYFLSALHMAINALGVQLIFWTAQRPPNAMDANSKQLPTFEDDSLLSRMFGNLHRQSLDKKGRRLMLAFSFVFSSNVAIGNVSLKYVSVNFNQVMRSLVPALTIAMGFALGKPTSINRQLAVVPVIVGVAMACFGDMTYTTIGFLYTLLCIFLAALKVMASGEMLTGPLKLHPFDLLGHMAPLAFIQCLMMSMATGEVNAIAARWDEELNPFVHPHPFLVVMMSAFLSFTFNVSSFQTNKVTSPLTLCIAGNVKQVLMIIIATAVFSTPITPLNASGIVVVLAGSAWYSYISVLEKDNSKNKPVHEVDKSDKHEDVADGDDLMVELLPKTESSEVRGVQRTLTAPPSNGALSSKMEKRSLSSYVKLESVA